MPKMNDRNELNQEKYNPYNRLLSLPNFREVHSNKLITVNNDLFIWILGQVKYNLNSHTVNLLISHASKLSLTDKLLLQFQLTKLIETGTSLNSVKEKMPLDKIIIRLDYIKLLLNFISPEFVQFDLKNLTDKEPMNKWIKILNQINNQNQSAITEFFRHTIIKNFPINDKMIISNDFIDDIRSKISTDQFPITLVQYLITILATLNDLNSNSDFFNRGFVIHLFTRESAQSLINHLCFKNKCEYSMVRFATNSPLSEIAPFQSLVITKPMYPLCFNQFQQFDNLLCVNNKLHKDILNMNSEQKHYLSFDTITNVIDNLHIINNNVIWQEFKQTNNIYQYFEVVYKVENSDSNSQIVSNHSSTLWNKNHSLGQQQIIIDDIANETTTDLNKQLSNITIR